MSSIRETARPHGSLFNLLRRLHFYIGLFIAPFIFIAALTGTLYVLTPQIENVLYSSALTTEAQGVAKPLSAQITAARRYIGEGARIYAVRPAPARRTPRACSSTRAISARQSRDRCLSIPIPYRLRAI